MTKLFNRASGKYYDSEILEMLNNNIQIKKEFNERAKEYFEKTKINLRVAIKKRNHYEKTGKLLPEVTKKD